MKSLVEFIKENHSSDVLKPSNDSFLLLDTIKAWLGSIGQDGSKLKKETYSLTNKQDAIYLWNDFTKYKWTKLAVASPQGKSLLNKFGFSSGEDLVKFLFDNKATLLDPDGKYKWDQKKFTKHIAQFNKTKLEQEYDNWKNSNDAVEPHKFDDEDYEVTETVKDISKKIKSIADPYLN